MKPHIYIFEPSSPSDRDTICRAIDQLKGEFVLFGQISVKPFGPIGEPNPQLPYLASSDEAKARLFAQLISKCKKHSFILLSRGGYGSMRWIEKVELNRLAEDLDRVLFIGFSDATFLACKLLKLGHKFLHAPMLSTYMTTSKKSRDALLEFLATGHLPKLEGNGLVSGISKGKVVGGNLTCLCHTLGTRLEPDWTNRILFIEDCNEEIYRIDRMLTHLLHKGVLRQVEGIAVGSFILKDSEKANSEILQRMLEDRLAHLGKPLVFDLPAGHGERNYPILLGTEYVLDGTQGSFQPVETYWRLGR